MGLGIAWRLAQSGCRVTVYDAGAAGQGASWAAAGMLGNDIAIETVQLFADVLAADATV